MASAVIGSLRANLGLDSSRFEKGAKGVKDPLKAMRNQFLLVSAAAAAFGVAIVKAAMSGAAEIDKTAKAARRLDASIGAFRAVELAADEAGVSLSSLTNDIQTMNRELSIAGEGGPVDDALAKLGLSAENLLSMDIDERVATIADRIKELGLTAGDATAILRDFGVRNREMALLMINGGDAIRTARNDVEDYGLALNDVDASNIEQANDSISRLSIVSQYFGQQLALVVVPALGHMAEALTNSMREGGFLRTVLDGFVAILPRLATYITTVVALFGTRYVAALVAARIATLNFANSLAVLRGAVVRTGIGVLIVGVGELVYQLGLGTAASDDLAESTDTTTEAHNDLAAAMGGVSTSSSTAAGNSRSLALAHQESAKQALSAAEAELRLAEARAASAEQDIINAYGAHSSEDEAARDQAISDVEAASARIAQIQADIEETRTSLREAASRELAPSGGVREANEAMAALEEVVYALDPALSKMDQYEAAVSTLNSALRDGLIDQEQYNHYLALAEERLNGVTTASGGAASAASRLNDALGELPETVEAIEVASDGLSDRFAGVFTNALMGVESLRTGLGKLAGELAQMLLNKAFKSIFNNILGDAGGEINSFLGFNANGDESWRGGMSVVGERGPEIVNVPRGAQIMNAHETSQALARPQMAAAPQVNVEPKIINVLDPSIVGEYLGSPGGERAIMNVMRRNGVVSA